ncbi:DUF3107 domain-containing protein [Candidatus Rhodoluna planktonica]|uniref:ATP-binding protein n=1 Tax=Candidatus Rhodoluna planktonica TaxID=535712 RepID=A0A1D9DZS7_9MICO|nr:DUF3107 domain-containing protein [Candidatus Rhodoluna planktonica]AOY56306.1 ATP-binding protein [Candidatus Rhodoluna planktonica]
MDIRIGIKHSGREISFETDRNAAEIESAVSSALETGAKLIKLSDSKGKVYLIPAEALSYLEIGVEETRRVGFIA